VTDDPVHNSLLAASLDDLKPYVAAAGLVGIFAIPAEIVVPVVRRLRGQTGVALGPGLVNLANGLLALCVVRFFRQRPEVWREWRTHIPRWSVTAGMVYLVLGPMTATGWKRAVLLPRRSPLWGTISPIGLLQGTLLIVAFARARRARTSETTPSPRNGAAS
jgi:hypothetical protein